MARPSVKLCAKSAARFKYPDTRRSCAGEEDKMTRSFRQSQPHGAPLPSLKGPHREPLIQAGPQAQTRALPEPVFSSSGCCALTAPSLGPVLPPFLFRSPPASFSSSSELCFSFGGASEGRRSQSGPGTQVCHVLPPTSQKMRGLGGREGAPGLTLSPVSVASMGVTMSMSVPMTVSMAAFHMPYKLLHHEEGDNSAENPQSHRQNGALAWGWEQHNTQEEADSRCSCTI